jgi:CheY-like chemotaxis protein
MEAIGVLASGIAHDMNNILASVLGFTELMLQSMPGDSPYHEDLETVRDAGLRGAELVKQILAFSRRQILERSVLDLNKVVTNYHAFIARVIGENIQTCLNLARELRPVLADETQIGQVLMNLAVNARDAMEKGGSLSIETANVNLDDDLVTAQFTVPRGAYVLLAVGDTGHGMDAETQARIFEPFFTTKEVGRGTGLGLSTVYGIVKQHGGFIWVESTVGAGTTFKVYLPITERVVNPVKPAGGERTLDGSETVLVVEDDDKIRNLVCTILRKHGYTAIDAPNGQAALEREAAHAGEIDLLLTDVMMPGMDGRELYRMLSERRNAIRVLFSSGHAHDIIGQHRTPGNGDAYISKPFAIRALLEKVREVLDRDTTVSRG